MPRQRNKIRTTRRLAGLPPGLRPLWPRAKQAYTLGVRTVAPLMQWLSRLGDGQLPSQIARTVDDAVSRGDAEMLQVHEPQRLSRKMPDGTPRGHQAFLAELVELVPRVVVAELPGGRILGPYRAVISRSGALIDELSPYFGTTRPLEHPVFLHPFPAGPVHVKGRVGVLAARGDVSYYHYLLDVLPRLWILEHAQVLAGLDRLYLPATLPFQRQLIDLLGIPEDRIIDSDEVRHLRADTLVVPGLPDANLKTPPWVVEFLRKRLLPDPPLRGQGRRIYATRGERRGSRIVLNEAEVREALCERGFEVVDPGTMPVAEQITTFAEAETIVAPHGGALTNVAFASPGALVVELFAPDYVQGCYWKLSECVPGLKYRYLVGQGDSPRAGRMWGVDSDITVDVRALLALLD